ncbi:MAG: Rap1a/Tai family immunity protein [Betaproteobacteria bacterium]|nr:Rap1a/Tai family immunity protein [Betaproteobacteria bacterium]MDH3438661.1 Rap1a/Tai family immunity protein [Betaproteobacteria bacterium]
MKRAILLLVGMLSACPAGAVTTGHDLLEFCSEPETDATFESGVCNGYVAAIFDVMLNYPFSGLQACFPVEVTRGQLVRVSTKFLREHPGVLHLSAYNNVTSALLLAFPCKR